MKRIPHAAIPRLCLLLALALVLGGLALAEAMSAGLPAVGRKSCAAVNELIVNGKTGFLVEEGAESFAQSLECLMSDQPLRMKMGHAAHESVKAYAPEKIWDEWESIIREVLISPHMNGNIRRIPK